MRNPDSYCANCGHSWSLEEEACPECGFDPVGNPEDDARNELAKRLYKAYVEDRLDDETPA